MQNNYSQSDVGAPTKKAKKSFNSKTIIYTICGVACVAFIAIIVVVLVTTLNRPNITETETFVSNDKQTSIAFTPGPGEGANSLVDTHLVYSYDNDNNVIGLKTYFKYPDEETAKKAYESVKNQPEFKGAVIEGNYIVVTAEESQFKGLTASDIRQQAEAIKKYQDSLKPQDEPATEEAPAEMPEDFPEEQQDE